MTRTSRNDTTEKNSVTSKTQFSEDAKLQSKQDMLKSVKESMRDITYDASKPTDISEETRLEMESQGYELRWIRYTEAGDVATRNLRKRRNQGYTFVTLAEVPDMGYGLQGIAGALGDDDFVILDDLVLAKIKIETADGIRNDNCQEARRQDEAIRVSLSEKEVHNRSVSTSSSGKKSAFAEDK